MSAESLIESLERLRWQLCDYVDQPTCDCKYGASGRGEQTGCPELRDAIYTLRGLRAERDAALAALARVQSLCDVVRRLQAPDSDTGDRSVSFFALLDAIEPDDDVLAVPEPGEQPKEDR